MSNINLLLFLVLMSIGNLLWSQDVPEFDFHLQSAEAVSYSLIPNILDGNKVIPLQGVTKHGKLLYAINGEDKIVKYKGPILLFPSRDFAEGTIEVIEHKAYKYIDKVQRLETSFDDPKIDRTSFEVKLKSSQDLHDVFGCIFITPTKRVSALSPLYVSFFQVGDLTANKSKYIAETFSELPFRPDYYYSFLLFSKGLEIKHSLRNQMISEKTFQIILDMSVLPLVKAYIASNPNLTIKPKLLSQIPTKWSSIDPVYAGRTIKTQLTIEPSGRVSNAHYLGESRNHPFLKPVIEDMEHWFFFPALENGTPVMCKVILPLHIPVLTTPSR